MFGVAGLPCPWLLPRCTELSRCTLYTTTGEVRTLNLSTERDSGKLGFYVGLKTKTIIGILMITLIIKHQAYFAQSFVLCTLLVVHQLHFQSVHRSYEDIPVLGLTTLVVSLWNWKLGLTSSYIKTHVEKIRPHVPIHKAPVIRPWSMILATICPGLGCLLTRGHPILWHASALHWHLNSYSHVTDNNTRSHAETFNNCYT